MNLYYINNNSCAGRNRSKRLFMGMQIDNVWQFGLRLTNTAFKPALGELRKKHPVCTKIRLFEIQNRKFFSGEGAQPLPHTPPLVGRGTPPPHTPPGPGASIFAPTVPTLLFRKRSLSMRNVYCQGVGERSSHTDRQAEWYSI